MSKNFYFAGTFHKIEKENNKDRIHEGNHQGNIDENLFNNGIIEIVGVHTITPEESQRLLSSDKLDAIKRNRERREYLANKTLEQEI